MNEAEETRELLVAALPPHESWSDLIEHAYVATWTAGWTAGYQSGLRTTEERMRDLAAVYASDPYCWTKGDDIAATILAAIDGGSDD